MSDEVKADRMDIASESDDSVDSSSSMSPSLSNMSSSEDMDASGTASGPKSIGRAPVPVSKPSPLARQKRRQFFDAPRVCVNCHFQFVRSAQYSGHLKQCRPGRPWNGVPTRSRKPRLSGGNTAVADASGPADARVKKRTLAQKAPRVTEARETEIVSSPLMSSSDESESTQTARILATTMGTPPNLEQSFVTFVRQHMDLLSPCTTREQLEIVDAQLQKRIEALHRMRTVAHTGIRRFQLAEAAVSENIGTMSASMGPEHGNQGLSDMYY